MPSWVVDLDLDKNRTRASPLAHPFNVISSTTGYVMNAKGCRHGIDVHKIRFTRIKIDIDKMIISLMTQLRQLEHYVITEL